MTWPTAIAPTIALRVAFGRWGVLAVPAIRIRVAVKKALTTVPLTRSFVAASVPGVYGRFVSLNKVWLIGTVVLAPRPMVDEIGDGQASLLAVRRQGLTDRLHQVSSSIVGTDPSSWH